MRNRNYSEKPSVEELWDRVTLEQYDYIFASRILEGEDLYEKRYYYFVDLSLMCHDKDETLYFMSANVGANKLEQVNEPPSGVGILYLDRLILNKTKSRISHNGYVEKGWDLLLEYFWSDKVENLSDDENILMKDLDKTKFLDLYESLKGNGWMEFK